jgi:hypothetical protein
MPLFDVSPSLIDLKIPPVTYNKAICYPDSDHWLATMHKEINLMLEITVYKLVVLPPGCHVIGYH